MSKEQNTFKSTTFKDQVKKVKIGNTTETVLCGYNADGTRNLSGLKKAFKGVDQLAVIGWSSQGPAQAQNLRDSFKTAGVPTKVIVGLRKGSKSRKSANKAGFKEKDGTLLTPEQALKSSDMVLFLIADAAMAEHGQKMIAQMKPGSTVGLSHGFYLGHLKNIGQSIRKDVDVVGVCPKGMGPSVRRLYEQGSGINNSFAVVQGGVSAQDKALGWSVGLGAPYTFKTTLQNEWKSDIFGERAMLLGGVHGVVEALYSWQLEHKSKPEVAYVKIVEAIVGPISKTISISGLQGLVKVVKQNGDEAKFKTSFNAAFPKLYDLTRKIYADVSSGREIAEVISDNVNNIPMTVVDGGQMWRVGEKVRASKKTLNQKDIEPVVAGVYVAGMVAQVTVLRENGHYWSEVVNESIIEAVDSLNPYMRAQGVAYMVDNCSVTARRGSRKWAPLYQAWLSQGVLPVIDGVKKADDKTNYYQSFVNNNVHDALKTLSAMRPPIDIAVK